LRKKIQAGADFAELARQESDDAGSGANGGDLGSFRRGQMVPTFEQAAFAMQPGDLSEPVKTPFGYHVIKVEAKESKSFDEVRPGAGAPHAPRAGTEDRGGTAEEGPGGF